MPIAMTTGFLFYPFFSRLAPIIPYLIFTMLFLTYSKIDFRFIRLKKMHFILILIQIFGSIGVYLALKPVNEILAQGAMICVLAPTATSAPVITKMLKGNVESLTAYSFFCNMIILIGAPIFFSLINSGSGMTFAESFFNILKNVALLLLVPFLLALLMRRFTPKTTKKIGSISGMSFYLWSFALIIVTAKTVKFITMQSNNSYLVEIMLAVVTLIICLLQFIAGRRIGRRYNDTVAGGQGLGQKNTVLAIWMAQTFLNPLSSVGPGAYVIWQNIVNSYQIWRKRKTLG